MRRAGSLPPANLIHFMPRSSCFSFMASAAERSSVFAGRTSISMPERSVSSNKLSAYAVLSTSGPVKTRAGKRNLPLLKLARQALDARRETQAQYRVEMGSAWPDTDLIFTTRTGRPVEPRNLVRSFRRICQVNQIRAVRLHDIRHTVASLLKSLGVPARDAQVILGHSRLAVTLEIYTHTDEEAQLDALTRLHDLLDEAGR